MLGGFDHIYDDNRLGVEKVNTHYVAIGYEVHLPEGRQVAGDAQHHSLRWFSVEELLHAPSVHENTKLYFR